MSYEAWQPLQAPPWLQGPNGSAWFAGFGSLKDEQVEVLRQAVLAAFPQYAPADAIPPIGSEQQIYRGYTETEPAYVARLVDPWSQWQRASWAAGLLLALYYDGYTDAMLVQQNGFYYKLAFPLAADPLNSLTIGTLSTLSTPMTKPGRPDIPTGTPWWTFDSDTEHCSRYAILLPSQPAFWMHKGVATFAATASAPVAWSQPFPSAVYSVLPGPPETTDGAVVVQVDPASKTTTGATVSASDAFTGTVDVIAWAAGENPFCCPDASALANLRRAIRLWAPAKAKCEGIFALVQGGYWDWTMGTWDGDGGTWGDPHEVVAYTAAT